MLKSHSLNLQEKGKTGSLFYSGVVFGTCNIDWFEVFIAPVQPSDKTQLAKRMQAPKHSLYDVFLVRVCRHGWHAYREPH